MSDLLNRLRGALPSVEAWIGELLAVHRPSASTIDTRKFNRLPQYLPSHVLQAARFVLVERTPFPPVSHFGVPEFAAMEAEPMGGITFGQTYFVSHDHATNEGTHFHELVHTIQWSVLGVRDFLLTYGLGLAMLGYHQSPLESIAFALQDGFERGQQILDLERQVTEHALQTRSTARLVFARNGVPWDA